VQLRGVKASCKRCMRTLQSPYEIIGDDSNEDGHRYQPLDRFILRELLAGQRRQSRMWTRSPAGRDSHYLRAWCLHRESGFKLIGWDCRGHYNCELSRPCACCLVNNWHSLMYHAKLRRCTSKPLRRWWILRNNLYHQVLLEK